MTQPLECPFALSRAEHRPNARRPGLGARPDSARADSSRAAIPEGGRLAAAALVFRIRIYVGYYERWTPIVIVPT